MGFFKDHYTRPGPGIPKDSPKKKGFLLFFDIFFREIFELIKLNLLFILFCIPVVTIPAAITAMSRVTLKMVRDENHFLWADFWTTFRKEFVPSTLGGWPLLLIMGMSVLGTAFYSKGTASSPLFMIPMMVTLVIGFVSLIASFYFFPMVALVDLPLRRVLKNAVLLSFACLLPNLLAAAVFLISLFFLMVFLFFAAPMVLFIACSLLNFVCTFIAYAGIKKFVITHNEAPPDQ